MTAPSLSLASECGEAEGPALHRQCRPQLYREPPGSSKVATYRHVYRAEPKELTLFGSVSGSEIQNLPFSLSGIVSLYWSEPNEPT